MPFDGVPLVHAQRAGIAWERRCRVCACTELNACEGGCSWVAEDLCSRCVDPTAVSQRRSAGPIVRTSTAGRRSQIDRTDVTITRAGCTVCRPDLTPIWTGDDALKVAERHHVGSGGHATWYDQIRIVRFGGRPVNIAALKAVFGAQGDA